MPAQDHEHTWDDEEFARWAEDNEPTYDDDGNVISFTPAPVVVDEPMPGPAPVRYLHTTSTSEWRENPQPVSAVIDAQAFPVETLPEWLADMVRAVSLAAQVPADLPGVAALGLLSVACAGRVFVSPKAGWTEPTNLYLASAAPPGRGKSPAFSMMTPPLYAVQKELATAARDGVVRAAAEAEMAAELAKAKKAAALKAKPEDREAAMAEAADAAVAAAALVVPALPRLTADDVTPEVLASLMCEQGGRLAVVSDEASAFSQMMGLYSSGVPNVNVYLKAHPGSPLEIDRRGRQEFIERPALTVSIMTQPGVLRELGARPELVSRGLPHRFLWAVRDGGGRRDLRAAAVPGAVSAIYETEMTDLLRGLFHFEHDVVLSLSHEADDAFFAWAAEVEEATDEGGRLHELAEWGSKLAGHTLRLAGLLHVAEHGHRRMVRPISGETMAAAVTLARYFADHALVAFDLLGANADKAVAEKVLRALRRNPSPVVSQRDLFNLVRGNAIPRSEALVAPLTLLCDLGWLREAPTEGPGSRGGRPPSPRYEVHPDLLG